MRKLLRGVERRRLLSAMIAIALCFSAMLGILVTSFSNGTDSAAPGVPAGNGAIPATTLALTDHDPILINGNAGFTNESGVVWGSGTASDPYIIADWNISAFPYNGIAILHSDVHFIIRNCHIRDGSTVYVGIYLWDCSNGTLYGNNCSNNMNGISLQSSSNNTLSNNTCSNGFFYGMYLESSSDNTLTNNTCSSNKNEGIILDYSNNNILIGNNCSSNIGSGIYLISSSSNNLTSNNCSSNGWHGIYFTSLKSPPPDILRNNRLINNTCFSNYYDGIMLGFSDSNDLMNNTCSSNGWHGISLAYASSNNLTKNTCSNNVCGLFIGSSFYNMIQMNWVDNNTQWGIDSVGSYCVFWNNTLCHNNGAGDTYDPAHVQARQGGPYPSSWNSADGYGNYWSDWTGPDLDRDGIVDYPYVLDGGVDNYPRTTTPSEPIPELSMMPFVVVLMAAILLTIGARRRKA